VSRRRERARGRAAPSGREAARSGSGAARGAAGGVPGRPPPRISFVAQAGILVAVFAIVTLIAELAGAANLGVSLGIGSIFFSIALVAVIVRT
jgi:hypothetical protein